MPDVPQTLRSMIESAGDPVFAPLVLNPLMARLAEQAGFRALYLGGGSMGFVTCFTEANLSLTEMARHAPDIRTTDRSQALSTVMAGLDLTIRAAANSSNSGTISVVCTQTDGRVKPDHDGCVTPSGESWISSPGVTPPGTQAGASP